VVSSATSSIQVRRDWWVVVATDKAISFGRR
jgi:hypothetical protein